MKNYAEPGKCTRCKHQDSTHANECRLCHYVTLCMVTIHKIWRESELDGLADDLRSMSANQFMTDAREKNAFLRVKLANSILRLSWPAKVSPDDLKRRIISAIDEYLGEMDGIRKYESKPGTEGAWNRHALETVSSWVGKAIQSRS